MRLWEVVRRLQAQVQYDPVHIPWMPTRKTQLPGTLNLEEIQANLYPPLQLVRAGSRHRPLATEDDLSVTPMPKVQL